MSFLEHGDIRKAGRALLIACTIYLLLNECGGTFQKIVLFNFEVHVSRLMMLSFLVKGIWILIAIFVVRFFEGFSEWQKTFLGTGAAETWNSFISNDLKRPLTGILNNLGSGKNLSADNANLEGGKLNELRENLSKQLSELSHKCTFNEAKLGLDNIFKNLEGLETERADLLVQLRRESVRFRLRRVGELIDVLVIQIVMPALVVGYALGFSTKWKWICSSPPIPGSMDAFAWMFV